MEEAFEALGVQPGGRENPVFDGLVAANNIFIEEANGDPELHDVHILGLGVKNKHLEIASYENLIELAEELETPEEVISAFEQNLEDERETHEQLLSMSDEI